MPICRLTLRATFAAALCALISVVVQLPGQISAAPLMTVVDNGPSANRVDIVFIGDGYTQSQLDSGLYTGHVQQYVDYMFGESGFLADPFPRYRNFFNVHQIEVASLESGADHPSQGVYRNTAFDATYDTSGIARLLTINSSKANAAVNEHLAGTAISADMRLATVNDSTYGGSGGTWAVYAGPNGQARELALHEISHAFSKTADEYATRAGTFPGGEPAAVNATKDSAGTKWAHWLGFEDPRADYLDIGVYEGAADYPLGVYRPSLDSKMRTLGRPFNAVVREKSILDIYRYVDPLDDWMPGDATIDGGTLWVETVDPDVIAVDWYVDDQLVATDYGEHFDLADFDFAAGTYSVRAHAYDEVIRHAGDGGLLDLVRINFGELQQNVTWTVLHTVRALTPGDYNGDGTVNDDDLAVWRQNFGSTSALAADGNGNLVVDAADYTVWRDSLGGISEGADAQFAQQTPEPGIAAHFVATLAALFGCRPGRRRGTVSQRGRGV